jgi:thiol:disulfide interchange protein DsbD
MAITVRIDQETTVFSPNSEGYLVLHVEIPRGSHIYGNPHGPGTGKPTVFSVPPVQDIVIENARYLPAKKYKSPDDRDFVWIYEGSTKFFFPVKVNASAAQGVRKLTINIEGLLCTDSSCMPWEQTVKAEVRIVREATSKRPYGHEYAVSAPGSESTDEGSASADNGISDGNALLEGIQLLPRHVSGVGVTGVLQALVFGILAGLLLNFMPCVLPVVSIKILGFVRQAGEEKSIVVKSGLLFALGILTVFGVLAGLAAFLGYGWGGLFQKTGFLVAMISVVFVLALSMFDVFTIHVPALAGKAAAGTKNTLTDAYIKGVLATFLATPCSGPFLGGTLAWAMMQPPLVIFLVFISVGAGMALPYIVLSGYPALLRFIPKPGEWMVTLERVMGFLLLGTVVYLAGILESAALVPTLWFLMFLLAGFWQYGTYGALHRECKIRVISLASLIAIVACGYLLSFHVMYGGRGDAAEIGTSGFSVNRLLHNRESGTISVV